jgi:hypothetical protein
VAKKPTTLGIELTRSAKAKLGAVSDHHGMTQHKMASRLAEWFVEQDPLIQSAILGRYPTEHEAEIARIILRRMDGEG